jgi:hypothetical protein
MPQATFQVADLPTAEKPRALVDPHASVQSLLRRKVEAAELSDARLVCCKEAHPFAQAAHDAFYDHYPLTISPDDVWFCVAQAFAHHVNLHAEALRHHFVQHKGKKKLTVDRPDFELGRPNPWPEAFTAFSQQIAAHVGMNLRQLIVADFSTTTLLHRAATEVTLMDAFQPYFEYAMRAGCGIPQITLTGAPDDWRDIRRRAALLAPYGLEEWISILLPILDQIEATARGFRDPTFWNSFFRYDSGSGGSAMTGWIQVLFPYLRDRKNLTGALVPNPYLATWDAEYQRSLRNIGRPWRETEDVNGPYLLEIPPGLASAPVKVIDMRSDKTHDMRFVAGMFGVAQDSGTKSLSPAFGWAIVYDQVQPLPAGSRRRRLFSGDE